MDKKIPYIRMVITDVDGTLTDGSVICYENGSTARVFDTSDGHGFYLAEQAQVPVALMSRSNSPEIMHRAKHLNCEYFLGIADKRQAVVAYAEFKGVDLDAVCFFGNDVHDLGAMSVVGYPACPKNAHPLVKHYISEQRYGFIGPVDAGSGAFRNLVDHLMLHSWRGIRWGF